MFAQPLVWGAIALDVVFHLVLAQVMGAPLAQGPIEVDGLLANLKTWSLSILTGVVAIVFIWKLIGHIKESPIDWKAVVGDLAAIAFLAAVAFNSDAVMNYVKNNITFNSQ